MTPLQDLDPGPMYMTTKALGAYLGYQGKAPHVSAHKFIARHGLRRYARSGRCVLVKRVDVDAVLAGER